MVGPGNRVPQAMQSQLRAMAKSGLIIPSVASYVQYVVSQSRDPGLLTNMPVFLMRGSRAIIRRHLTVCIDISTTPCRVEIAHCTSMPC